MLATPPPINVQQAAHFLRVAYELERAQHGPLDALLLARKLRVGHQESHRIRAYLVERGFIEVLSLGELFRLSPKGRAEVEWALANPCFLHDLFNETMEVPAKWVGR